MRELTINTAQGIGDVCWVLQKLYAHVDRINVNLCRMSANSEGMKLQSRAEHFLKLIPKVGAVNFVEVSQPEYIKMISRRYDLKQILAGGSGPFDFCVNHPLEDGIRLEDIDPDLEVIWDLPVDDHFCPLPYKDYFLLYVSGSINWPGAWSDTEQWVELVTRLYQKNGWNLPIIMIGAFYDKKVIAAVAQRLQQLGHRVATFIDIYPGNACYILRNATFMAGFQSGLSILADIYDVPQLMLYFPLPDHYLAPTNPGRRLLTKTWAKPKNIANKVYNYDTFERTPAQVVEALGVVKTKPPGKTILLTCGAGDFVALESTLTQEERESVHTIYYATRARELVQTMASLPGVFPNVRYQVAVYDKFRLPGHNDPFCFERKEELKKVPLEFGPVNWDDVEDWSIQWKGAEFFRGDRRLIGSSLVKKKLADVSKLGLPEKYVAIHNFSDNAMTDQRDITPREWKALISYLDRTNIQGVVVNKGPMPAPAHPRLIDLTNKLTFLEALEVVKGASVFVGCSSVFSVLAAKVLPAERLVVKGHEVLRDKWAPYYYGTDAACAVFPDLEFLKLYGPAT